MRAAWYEKQGPARRVLIVGEMPDPHPTAGEVRIRIAAWGWPMVFKNIRLFFLGSDDFPTKAKMSAAQNLNSALEAGWSGFEIAERIPLAEIARAHEASEHPVRPGRVVVIL